MINMVKVGIIACKIAMDSMCPGCAKCFKAAAEKSGGFSNLNEPAEIVFLTSCGGCPGLIPIKMDLINRTLSTLNQKVDIVYIGTCVQRAIENFNCPIDPGFVKTLLEKLGVRVIVGTHAYPIYHV